MLSRRDCLVAAIAACATMAVVVAAESGGKPVRHSKVFRWDGLVPQTTPVGEKRSVFLEPTATLDQLSCHVTTVTAGNEPHPPHQHVEEELIIVKEGTLEVMQNGVRSHAEAGSVIFEASNELHGLRNVGDGPATYFVIKFWPPGMLAGAAK